jgi:hypothetical protein
METIILWLFVSVMLILSFIFFWRNNKVLKLRRKILDASHQYTLDRIDEWEPGSGFIGYNELVSYETMLWSLTPLNPKSHLSEETYEILKPYLSE